jgi:hypothetical protein
VSRSPVAWEWGGSPPPRPRRGGDSSCGRDWLASAASLRESPGQWAHVAMFDSASAAKAVSRINQAVGYDPAYQVEQHGREVWARWVGHQVSGDGHGIPRGLPDGAPCTLASEGDR